MTDWVSAAEEAFAAIQLNETQVLLPHQIPPDDPWDTWILLAGRGAGKTRGTMNWLNERCLAEEGLRARIIAPTLADAVSSCVEGPNGLLTISNNKAVFHPGNSEGSHVKYPNDSKVWLIGTPTKKDVDRLRALTNIEIDVFEEAFANPRLAEAWQQADLSRRRGNPRVVVASTPRPHPIIKDWQKKGYKFVRATMSDNPYNPPSWVEKMKETYAGTRLYKQEILGEVIEQVEGALWTQSDIDRSLFTGDVDILIDQLTKIVIGVDPPSGAGTCGIVVAGKDKNGMIYILDDYSITDATPNQWAEAVSSAQKEYGGLVVAEINQGGRMVTEILAQVDKTMPIKTVNARVGKQARAEPIALLWEAEIQKAKLAPSSNTALVALTDQLLAWVPGMGESPDRLDAMVWACTYLLKGSGSGAITSTPATASVSAPNFRNRKSY